MGTKLQNPEEINKQLYRFDRIHQPVKTMDDVLEEQLKQYKEQGFVAVEQVLDRAQGEAAVEELMRIILDPETKAGVQFTKPQKELHSDEERELAVRKLYQFVDHSEVLRAIAYHPAILSLIERIIGEEPVLVQDMALLKPPFGGGEKPWHQDMAYGALAFDKAVIGIWIALDEAGLENGCMHVIPRSHMEGGVPHYAVRDWQLCDANVPVERDVAVPLPSCGALFFHGLLFHGTPYNLTAQRRRALQFHYAPKSAVKLGPGEYKRMFTNAMTSAEC